MSHGYLLRLVSLVFNSRLNSLDLNITLLIRILILLDEVLGLEDCLMWVDLHDVHVHVLSLRDLLTSDDISHIDGTFVSFISGIIKENVLGVVIGLIDHKLLSTAVFAARCHVTGTIIRDSDSSRFLESLEIGLELNEVIANDLGIIVLINHVDVTVFCCGRVTLVLTIDLDRLCNIITSSVQM